MSKLKDLLKETDFTKDEWETYRKVQKNYQLQDLEELLDEMLIDGTINAEQFETATQKADLIVEKYDKWLEYDWRTTMKEAVNYILKGDL